MFDTFGAMLFYSGSWDIYVEKQPPFLQCSWCDLQHVMIKVTYVTKDFCYLPNQKYHLANHQVQCYNSQNLQVLIYLVSRNYVTYPGRCTFDCSVYFLVWDKTLNWSFAFFSRTKWILIMYSRKTFKLRSDCIREHQSTFAWLIKYWKRNSSKIKHVVLSLWTNHNQ